MKVSRLSYVFCFLCITFVSHAFAQDGLVARWDFDEGQGTVVHDRSGNTNDGAIHNATWVKCGKGFALQFDGEDDYVEIGKSASLDLTSAVTVEAWIHPDHLLGSDSGICGKSQVHYSLHFHGNGNIYWYVSAGSNHVSAPVGVAEWQHVVGTFDGESVVVYINGVAAQIVPTKIKQINRGGEFTIGKVASRPEYPPVGYFPGIIDAVRVYSRALSAEEVTQHYQESVSEYETEDAKVWVSVPGGVKREAVPSPLEGKAGTEKDIQQAKVWLASEKDGVSTFHITGDAPRERTMQWRRGVPAAERKPASFFRLPYQAVGVRRSFSVYPVVRLDGKNSRGLSESATLLDCTTAINDGRWHTAIGKLPNGFVPERSLVELSTTNDQAELRLASLDFYDSVSDLKAGLCDTTPVAPTCKVIDIKAMFNDSMESAFADVLKKHGMAVDGAAKFEAELLCVRGIPFNVALDGNNLIRPKEDFSVNEQTEEFLGTQIPRKHRLPVGRNDVTEIPVSRKVSEVFLLMMTEAPPHVNRYSRPQVPFELMDIEGFSVELMYAKGTPELAFPYSLADEGFVLRRVLGAYAVPADPQRTLRSVRLHNMTWGINVDIAAVTVNIGPKRLLPQLVINPAPVKPPMLPIPPQMKASVRRDADRVVVTNTYYDMVMDTSNGFAITSYVNRFAPGQKIVLSPDSGLEIRTDNRLLTGRDFAVQSVRVTENQATLLLESRVAAVPIGLKITITVNDSPQVIFNAEVSNTGSVPLASTIRFPMIKRLRIGGLDDTWLFFPQYLTVDSNENGYHSALNDRSYSLQFYDVYNPSAGVGLAVLTNNLKHVALEYCAAKRTDGVQASIDYPQDFYTLAPGETRLLVQTCLIAHTGDWHEALRLYKEWVRTWFQHHQATDRERFERSFLIRAEVTAEKSAQRIFHTPAMFSGTPGKFRLDEVMKANRDYLGLLPDVVHIGSWFHGPAGEESSWGDYEYTAEGIGGLESFRSLIRDLKNRYNIPLSIYTLPDRASFGSKIGDRIGAKTVAHRPDGTLLTDGNIWNFDVSNSMWRDYFVEALQRIQRDTAVSMLYIDVYGFFRGHVSYKRDRGFPEPAFQPNQATYDLAKRVRESLPPGVAIWSEYPLDDVSSQYHDGNIAYYYLTLHELFAESHNLTERVALFDAPKRDTYRFALPHIKQICFPVGIEGDYNQSRLKTIFFNGEALMDCTWRLFNDRVRAWLSKGIQIEREYADCFTTREPAMLVPTEKQHVYANRFPARGRTLWTLYNGNYTTVRGVVLSVEHLKGARYRDAWNGRDLKPKIAAGRALIELELAPQQLGCIVQSMESVQQ